MPYLSVILLASLPAPGLPPSAIDVLGIGGLPARMTKRSGYNAVQFAFEPSGSGSGQYALYCYWPDSKSWRPEGPRGATPATYDTSAVESSVPVRVSTRLTECEVCVVLVDGSGVTHAYEFSPAEIQEQSR